MTEKEGANLNVHIFFLPKRFYGMVLSKQPKHKTHRNIENDIMISVGLRWLKRKETMKISELKEMFQNDYVGRGF